MGKQREHGGSGDVGDLSAAEVARLRAASLTCAQVGATLGELSSGHHQLRVTGVVCSGAECFARAAATMLS